MAGGNQWVVAGDIGKRIRALRLALGWSQTQFGNAAGVRYDQVLAWEKGRACPPRGRLERLARQQVWPIEIFADGGPSPDAQWLSALRRADAAPLPASEAGLSSLGPLPTDEVLALALHDRPGLVRYLQALWGGDPRLPTRTKMELITVIERMAQGQGTPLPGSFADTLRAMVRERCI
ncbi:MAG: helix-turn-helix transcriptional regulator [Bryobacteraceae bacterium]